MTPTFQPINLYPLACQWCPQATEAGAAEDPAVVSELRQELEEVCEEASSTKEELSLYKERSDKLQEELLVREHPALFSSDDRILVLLKDSKLKSNGCS